MYESMPRVCLLCGQGDHHTWCYRVASVAMTSAGLGDGGADAVVLGGMMGGDDGGRAPNIRMSGGTLEATSVVAEATGTAVEVES